MLTTKKMMKDIKKLKKEKDDFVVCDFCGSEDIIEKIWVDVNNCIVINGNPYYRFNGETDDEMYWCDKCNDATKPVHISEYKEDEHPVDSISKKKNYGYDEIILKKLLDRKQIKKGDENA